MRLTIYRGTEEIGGNCVEFHAGSTRIVVDVGVPLIDSRGELFDSKLLKGKSNRELLDEHILPNVPGLFQGARKPQAILLSHAHLDHSGFIGKTPSEIPVYATKGTSKMMLAGEVFGKGERLPQERHEELISGRQETIGGFRVTAFAEDHSVYGSSALLIEADDKAVLYSGDIRLHGRHPEKAEQLLNAVKGQRVDALLMEGTHLGSHRGERVTEDNLEGKIIEAVQQSEGLVLASFSPQHVDRLIGFINAARSTGRTFVADAYTAFVMHLVHNQQLEVPHPTTDDQVRVFYPYYFEKKRWTRLHDMFRSKQISLDEVQREPKSYLMMFRPSMLKHDFHRQLPEGATCLYSQWEGYLERPEWQKIQSKLEAVGGRRISLHTSGHILEEDLVWFVREIDPRVVIPIHTLQPERLGELYERVHRIENGERYEVK